MPLEEQTVVVSGMLCQDPRDRIYGTLSMVEWGEHDPIEPDYSIDEFDLAVQILRRLRLQSLWLVMYRASTLGQSLELEHRPSARFLGAIQNRFPTTFGACTSGRLESKEVPNCRIWPPLMGVRLQFQNNSWRLHQKIGDQDQPVIHQWTHQEFSQSAAEILLPSDHLSPENSSQGTHY